MNAVPSHLAWLLAVDSALRRHPYPSDTSHTSDLLPNRFDLFSIKVDADDELILKADINMPTPSAEPDKNDPS